VEVSDHAQEEQEKILLATPAGQEAVKANESKSEEMYRRALELDSKNAKAYRGLGILFERSKRYQQALEEYRKYLELEPNAADRMRIQRRIEELEKRARGKS
jgi:Flp pilus assembly protein TadD